MEPTGFVTLSTTVNDENTAREMARRIVEQRLAACVQAVPIHSTYRWKSQVQAETEILLLSKTTGSGVGELKNWLLAHHPYETPEIVVTPIVDGSRDYLDWIARETGPAAPRRPPGPAGETAAHDDV